MTPAKSTPTTTSNPTAPIEPAIYYAPEAYRTRGPKLMGRNAAGEAFMRAWLKHSPQQTFRARVHTPPFAADFEADVHAVRPEAKVDCVTPQRLGRLKDAGVLYYPGPDIVQSAWERSLHGHAAWSLCGVTHTTASAAAMDAITGWLAAPVHPWDAVICTSTVVQDTVKQVLETQAQHLASRMGLTRLTLPMMPVIPLGVHSEDFQITPKDRSEARAALGLHPDQCVVLYVGRLSFHAKAHPLAMYQALQAAVIRARPAQRAVLIECGWYGNAAIEAAFDDAAKLAMPGVDRRHVDGRDAVLRGQAWAAADIFCSLSDNIQETFGLTPVEAMAAGLPSVVTDWNGYRDTVRHGTDGMRIPTWAPGPGKAIELARGHALGTMSYDHYCGHTSAAVAVDAQACADAFAVLIGSPELRRRMGDAAQLRARETFDWSRVYRQYESLWAELTRRRHAAAKTLTAPTHPWPARMDPFTAFGTYASQTLGDDTVLAISHTLSEATAKLQQYLSLAMVKPFAGAAADQALAQDILAQCATGPVTLSQLRALAPANARNLTRRVAWLCKLGLLQAAPGRTAVATSVTGAAR